MNKLRLNTLVCVLFILLSVNSYAEQTKVELETCNCSNQATYNKTILSNAIRSNTTVLLPSGDFVLDPITINGIDNLTLKGTVTGGSITTRIFMTGSTGLSLLNSSNIRFEDLEILSSDLNANLVVLSSAGDLSADNLLLAQGSSASTVCLQPNLDWLVPVISLILN